MDVFLKIWRRKLLVVLCTLVGGLCGIAYLQAAGAKYRSELRITPAASSESSISKRGGGLGGLASLAGVSLGDSEIASPFDLYLDALTSREVSEILARDKMIVDGAVPIKSSSNSSFKTTAKRLVGFVVPAEPPAAANRLQVFLGRSLTIAKKPNNPIVRIDLDTRDPAFGRYFLTKLNSTADELVRRQALYRSQRYASYLSERLATVSVAEHREMLAQALSDQEKAIMLASSGVPYAAMPLGQVISSDQPAYPRPDLALTASVLLGLLAGVTLALVDWSVLRRRDDEVA